MAKRDCSICGDRSVWLGLGIIAGALAGLKGWKRWQARRTSPLIRKGETLTALVTGASSGIGQAYATKLAELGYDVILVARRTERLEALASELREAWGVKAAPLTADLTTEEGISRAEQAISATDNLNLLVNNAGFGLVGPFAALEIEPNLAMVRLHVQAVVRLTRAALPVMLSQERGGIINVSSLMAFYPIAGSANYAGTKCYLRAFTEALHQELANTGVRVQSLCPGFVRTEMQDKEAVQHLDLPEFLWMPAETVVERSLDDLRMDGVISVPGLGYRFLAHAAGVIPRPLIYAVGRWFRQSRGM